MIEGIGVAATRACRVCRVCARLGIGDGGDMGKGGATVTGAVGRGGNPAGMRVNMGHGSRGIREAASDLHRMVENGG